MKHTKCIHLLLLAVASLLGSGCGLTVKQRAALLDFNRAATGFAQVAGAEFQHTREDVLKLNIYRSELGDASLDPEDMDGAYTPERVKVRLDAMAALQSYAEMLQKLVTGSQADELKSASDSLVANLRKAHAFEASDDKSGAIAQAIASVGGLWVEHKRAEATRRVTRSVDPAIKRLLAVVAREYRLNVATNWVGGYSATATTLIGRASFLINLNTNAPIVETAAPREARAYAYTVRTRITAVSEQITNAVQALGTAQDKLILTLESKDIGAEDVAAFSAQVQDFLTTYKTLSSK